MLDNVVHVTLCKHRGFARTRAGHNDEWPRPVFGRGTLLGIKLKTRASGAGTFK